MVMQVENLFMHGTRAPVYDHAYSLATVGPIEQDSHGTGFVVQRFTEDDDGKQDAHPTFGA